MIHLGKLLLTAGLAVALLGSALWGLGRLGFRGLPGDIDYQGKNVRVYFPIVSSLALSVLLSLGLWFWRWMQRK